MTNEVETFLAENAGQELAHYGIKGQKWGIRRSDAQLAKAGKVSKAEGRSLKDPSEDGARAALATKQLKKGGIEALSNDDIQALTTRLRLETSLAQAKSEKVTTLSRVDKKTRRALGYGATLNSAIKFAQSDAGALLLSGLTGKTGGGHSAKSIGKHALARSALKGAGKKDK